MRSGVLLIACVIQQRVGQTVHLSGRAETADLTPGPGRERRGEGRGGGTRLGSRALPQPGNEPSTEQPPAGGNYEQQLRARVGRGPRGKPTRCALHKPSPPLREMSPSHPCHPAGTFAPGRPALANRGNLSATRSMMH